MIMLSMSVVFAVAIATVMIIAVTLLSREEQEQVSLNLFLVPKEDWAKVVGFSLLCGIFFAVGAFGQPHYWAWSLVAEILLLLMVVMPVDLALDEHGAADVPEHVSLLVLVIALCLAARFQAAWAADGIGVFWGSAVEVLPWIVLTGVVYLLLYNFFTVKEREAEEYDDELDYDDDGFDFDFDSDDDDDPYGYEYREEVSKK